MSIEKELNSLAPDAIVTLFEFDTLPIIETPTGSDSLYYTNQPVGEDGFITWETNNYLPFPFEFSGMVKNADGSALTRPTITVSNITKTFFAIFLSLGDLSGVKVKRTVTCFKYTDLGSEPDPLAVLSVDEFVLVKKVKQDKFSIVYELATSLDQPNLRLPKRQILRDYTRNGLHAPGVSRVRMRS